MHPFNLNAFATFYFGFLVTAFCVLVGFLVERLRPARPQSATATLFNIAYSASAQFIQMLLMPMAAACTLYAVNAGGGGAIALNGRGWSLLTSLAIYILATDCGDYLFHRAQHRIPFLWAMHSLHHSDPFLNVSTTTRHFWAEYFIKSATVYLLLGLVFKVDTCILIFYSLFGYYNYFSHMNLRLGIGRWSFLINTPQYHRIHHSILDEHRDCNFAALLPIFDVAFGTYRRPVPGEFPPTGLNPEDIPSSIFEAVFWPFRQNLRLFSKSVIRQN